MVQTQEWGPPLWRVLHTWAERLGRQTIPLMATDERYAWVNLLRSIEAVMPCAKCRLHYKAWRLKHPYERLLHSYDIRADAREWLWALHQEVNSEKGVTGPALDELPALYGGTGEAVTADLVKVNEVFQLAAHNLQIKPSVFQGFRLAVANVRRFIG